MEHLTDTKPGKRPKECAPRLALPPTKPLTARERERRQKAVETILQLRHEIGPIGMLVTDLIREAREEASGG